LSFGSIGNKNVSRNGGPLMVTDGKISKLGVAPVLPNHLLVGDIEDSSHLQFHALTRSQQSAILQQQPPPPTPRILQPAAVLQQQPLLILPILPQSAVTSLPLHPIPLGIRGRFFCRKTPYRPNM
jgi:hypothetical protein